MKLTTLITISFLLIFRTGFSQQKNNEGELNKVIAFVDIKNYQTVKTSRYGKFSKRCIRITCLSEQREILLRKKIKVYKSGVTMEKFTYNKDNIRVKGLKLNDTIKYFYWDNKDGLPVKYVH